MGDCDVAIIGAGIIGASIAYELASRGASVAVLDSRPAGQGATQAAAGMLAPYIEGFGRPILTMAARSLGMYDEFIRRITADSGIAVDYHRDGSLQVITAEESAEGFVALQAAAGAAGVRCTLVDALQVRDLEPLVRPDIVAGALIPDHGVVVPTSLSHALTAAAVKRGARFEGYHQVERVAARDGGGFRLETRGDRVHARRVIVAGGSWSGRLAIDGVPLLPVRPVRGQLVHLSSPSPPPRRVIWGAGCYMAPSTAGSLSVGATMEEAGFDERATVAGVRGLLDAATELMPALRQCSFEGARVGLRPATPDEMPIMGRSHKLPGLFYATGHFRNGILLAPLTGRVLADLVLDNSEDSVLAATSPQRFGEY
jgi:glycine oxidase